MTICRNQCVSVDSTNLCTRCANLSVGRTCWSCTVRYYNTNNFNIKHAHPSS